MGRSSRVRVTIVVGVVAVALGTSAGAAHAKAWAKWAPSPLPSDSDYVAMSARPADSLDAGEFAWLTVQRDWRAQRAQEAGTGASTSSSLTGDSRFEHRVRSTDRRFAELASRHYASLSNREFAWLVSESGAQQSERNSSGAGGKVVAILAVAVVAGLVGAVIGIHAAIQGIFGGN